MTTTHQESPKGLSEILHKAHLAYQRASLADAKIAFGDYSELRSRRLISPSRIAVSEIRGVHYQRPKLRPDQHFQEHWMPKANSDQWNVRPRFWKCFADTIMFMVK